MPMMKDILGLDLGSHAVKAVELRQSLRELEPVQLRIQPRLEEESSLEETLQRFVRAHDLPTEHIIAAIPADRLTSRRLEFPFRDKKKLGAAVPFEVEGEVPFPLEDVIVDWELVGGIGRQGIVSAAIVQRRDVAAMLDSLSKGGCEPRVLEGEGLVLGNLAALFDLPGTRVLVDLGHRKTTLCLMVDGAPVAARTVQTGGAAITKALALERGIGLDEAERSKCEEGIFQLGFNSSSPGAVAVLERIARELIRFLEAHESTIGGAPQTQIAELTLMGGTARLHRIDEYLAERTGISASLISPPPENEGAALIAGGDPVIFAPAVALALRGTARTKTRRNFRQEEFAYRKDFRQYFNRDMRPTAILAGIALVLAIGLFVTSLVMDARRASFFRAQSEALYSEAFPDRPIPDNPVAAIGQETNRARELADFLGVYGGNLSALDALAQISRMIPQDLRVEFDQVTIDPNNIRIKAFSRSVADAERFENQLREFPGFAGAEISGDIKTDRKRNGNVFEVAIPLEQS